MKKIIFLTLVSLFMMVSSAFADQEKPVLLMFSASHCIFCKLFFRDIGVDGYNATKEGKILPLKVIQLDTQEGKRWYLIHHTLDEISYVNGTPIFIIYSNHREIGRLEGYGGKDDFFEHLDEAMKQLNID